MRANFNYLKGHLMPYKRACYGHLIAMLYDEKNC